MTAFTGCRPMARTSIPKRRCRSSTTTCSRISLRIKQLLTGKRHTQRAIAALRRLVSNIELLASNRAAILGRHQQHGVRIQTCAMTRSGPPATNTGCAIVDASCGWPTRRLSWSQRKSSVHALVPHLAGKGGKIAMIDKGPVLLDIADGMRGCDSTAPTPPTAECRAPERVVRRIMVCQGQPDGVAAP